MLWGLQRSPASRPLPVLLNDIADGLAKVAASCHAHHPQHKAEMAKADQLQRRVLRHLIGAQLAIEQVAPPIKWARARVDQKRRLQDAVQASQHVFQQELDDDGWAELPPSSSLPALRGARSV